MSTPDTAFHRLLTFFATRSPHPNKTTITFLDSLRGDLSVGLNLPFALLLALTRHLIFSNSGFDIHVPSVQTSRRLLGGVDAFAIDEGREYGVLELVGCVRGVVAKADAVGCWALVADRKGVVTGRDVRLFQRGEVMETLVERRRVGREDVLPFWRGGPIWVTGHSWAVDKLFDVQVYQTGVKRS